MRWVWLARSVVAAAGTLIAAAGTLAAQAPQQPADVTPGATATAPRVEPAVEGFTRQDRDTVALALGGGKTLLLHDFDFNGEPRRQPTSCTFVNSPPGVVRAVRPSRTPSAYWRSQHPATNAAAYYGLGEHFDTLNHAHTIVRNLSAWTTACDQGLVSAYKCIPFFLSTTGYGLWLDTTGEATFDLDASNRDNVDRSTSPATSLRVLLFTSARPDASRHAFPPSSATSPGWPGRSRPPCRRTGPLLPGRRATTTRTRRRSCEDIDRTRELGLPASVILIDSPWATAYNSYQFNPEAVRRRAWR